LQFKQRTFEENRANRRPIIFKKVLLNCASSCQTSKNGRLDFFLTGGLGQKTRREPILTKYGAARRILITLSKNSPVAFNKQPHAAKKLRHPAHPADNIM
jgi:hypothetical protein